MALIASWNVNSVNARLNHVIQFLQNCKPDVLLLQETKCVEEQFPFSALEDLGYNIKVSGQKSYNGVAIISKYHIEDVVIGLPTLDKKWPVDARYIEAFIMVDSIPVRVASVYVPNGSEVGSEKFAYKLDFLASLEKHMANIRLEYNNIAITGDLNVAPEEIDVYNPIALNGSIGFHIDERSALRAILNKGWVDSYRMSHPDMQEFSWWDYRSGGFAQNRGMRIDHILLSPHACDLLSRAEIYKETRGWERPSDHAPVLCKLG